MTVARGIDDGGEKRQRASAEGQLGEKKGKKKTVETRSTSGQFQYRHAASSSQFKSKIGNLLVKAAALRINLSLGVPVPHTTQCIRGV